MMRAVTKVYDLARLVALPVVLGSLLACGDDSQDAQRSAVVTQYVALVRANYDDAVEGANSLRKAVNALIEKPSTDTLKAARQAWIDARPAYLQSEAYRSYQGPIDAPETGAEGRINAWPLDEALIDYARNPKTGGVERKGIINDRSAFPVITEDVLIGQKAHVGDADFATGYHVIEFLLWGQDFSDRGPGDRPYTDFVGGAANPDQDSDRRRQYLTVVTDLLIEDLQHTRDAWNDGQPYLKKFLANLKGHSLKNMIAGISSMSEELAAERIRPAYDSQDQEDEHSCFSDNTSNDLKYDLVGIENVYVGRYGKLDGLGLEDLVTRADSALDLKIKSDLKIAAAALEAIPTPFDQAIKDPAALRKVRAALDALDALSATLAKLNATLKL